MPILKSDLEKYLRPFLLHHMSKDSIDLLLSTDFLRIYNNVARQINDRAQIRLERFYKKCNTDNAEDSSLTNYLVQGKIRKIFSIKFMDSDAAPLQYFTYVDDRVVLANAPTEDTYLDIYYLRDIEEVSADSDEIDLPDECLFEFIDLVQEKILTLYPSETYMGKYEALFPIKIRDISSKFAKPIRREIPGTWMGQTGDNRVYDITDHYIGLENFTLGVDGNYTYVNA